MFVSGWLYSNVSRREREKKNILYFLPDEFDMNKYHFDFKLDEDV